MHSQDRERAFNKISVEKLPPVSVQNFQNIVYTKKQLFSL